MSIATAIQNAQQKVANAYTAVNAKGGTLPATQDLSNLPTAIDSISTGGMDTVEATNYTENAISTGDKVWINKEGTDYKLVDFYKKYYNNFNVVGSPSIDRDSGYSGNFGDSSYCVLPNTFSPGNNTWEIVVCLNMTSFLPNPNYMIHYFGTSENKYSFIMSIRNISGSYYAVCFISSNGSSWDIESSASINLPISLNTKTWVKLQFTGTQYILSTSTDGINYTNSGSVTSSLSITQGKDIDFGAAWGHANSYLPGIIYLDETYIKIGDEIWWNPAENIVSGNITGDTLTGVADDNFTAASTSLNVDYSGSYVGTVLTSYVGNQTKANSTVTIYKNKSFECLFKVKKIDNNSGIRMFDCRKPNLATYPAFYIRNGDSRIWATANTSTSGSENYGYSYTIPNTNQWFYIKAYYDPSNLTVTYTWSYDKVTWTSIWSYTFTSSTWFNGNVSEVELIMYIGSQGGSNEAWTGLTDLSECYFKVDDQIVWNGTTFTPGGTGDVEIGEVIEPTLGTKTITQNGTYNASSDNLDGYSSVTVDVLGIPREVSAQGVYQMPTESFTFSLPSNATDVGNYALYYACKNCTGLTSIDLSSLITVSGETSFYQAFKGCTNLTSVDLSALTTISGETAFFQVFSDCTGLTNVSFPSLTTISGAYGLQQAFKGCTGLTDIYFNALTTTSFGSYTNQFNNMLQNTGTTKTHTLHFPSNMESTISGLTGYPLFGGTSGYVTCLFDLPATS